MKMAPKKSLYEKRLEASRKNFKANFRSRPERWLWTVKDQDLGDTSTVVSETDSEKTESVRLEGDDSLQGDISDMSEDERGIIAKYLKFQRRSRSK